MAASDALNDMIAQPYVLVIGAMAADTKGRPAQALMPGSSTPGAVRLAMGGAGRNIAENLARLGVHTVLLSAVGNDSIGRLILQATAESGVDTRFVVTSSLYRTGAYMAILDESGIPALAIDDMTVIQALTPALVYQRRRLLRDASMLVLDGNLPEQTLESVFKLARQYHLRVCLDPTTSVLAPRFRPFLSDIHLLTLNLPEARAIAGISTREVMDARQLAIRLVGMGVQIVIVTLAELGLCYATLGESGHVPALNRDIIDLTGAGNALTAAVILGLLHDFPVSEAVRLGISAAALTIQCAETVCPYLSLDRLYDELVI